MSEQLTETNNEQKTQKGPKFQIQFSILPNLTMDEDISEKEKEVAERHLKAAKYAIRDYGKAIFQPLAVATRQNCFFLPFLEKMDEEHAKKMAEAQAAEPAFNDRSQPLENV